MEVILFGLTLCLSVLGVTVILLIKRVTEQDRKINKLFEEIG